MKRWISRILAWALCLSLLGGACLAAPGTELKARGDRTIDGMKAAAGLSQKDPLLGKESLLPAGSSVSDWTALALAVRGAEENYEGYLSRLSAYVTKQYAEKGGLDRNRATEWHRIGLTVLALGGDPTAFGQSPEGTPIDLVAEGTYNYVGGSLDGQGTNGLVYALILLDAKGYPTPAGSRYTREGILAELLARQNGDGGFPLDTGDSEVDITAMALQALAPYQEGEARAAVEKALQYLSQMQEEDGGFSSYGAETSESAAQVVLALCALGMDPEGEGAFRKSGGSALDALLAYQMEDGSFSHIQGGGGDGVATVQALLALTAAEKHYAGQGRLFDFTAYDPPESKAPGGPKAALWGAVGAAALLCALGAAIYMGRRRKRS